VGIRLITRTGNDWTTRYPLVVEAVNHLKVRSCLIALRPIAGLAQVQEP
jgi:ATP-dependent DNA ligase